MWVLVRFLAVFAVGVATSIVSSFAQFWNPNYGKDYKPAYILIQRWLLPVTEILVVILATYPSGLVSVGLWAPAENGFNHFAAGFFIVIGCVGCYSFTITLFGPKRQNQEPERNAFLDEVEKFKTRGGRIAYLGAIVLGVFAEEIIYRGFLVLTMSRLTGYLILWAVFSVFLSVIVHLYQGKKHILLQVSVATAYVAITVLTGNLWTAIGAHLIYNIMVTTSVWRRKTGTIVSPQGRTGQVAASPASGSGKNKGTQVSLLIGSVLLLAFGIYLLVGLPANSRQASPDITNTVIYASIYDEYSPQERVDAYFLAMAAGDARGAYDMFSERAQVALEPSDIQAQLDRDYDAYFAQYDHVETTEIEGGHFNESDYPEYVTLRGVVYYRDGRIGEFEAVLDLERGLLKIAEIRVGIFSQP